MNELQELTKEQFAIAYLGEVGMRLFFAKVGTPTEPGGCMPWRGALKSTNYGRYTVNLPRAQRLPGTLWKASFQVHRLMYTNFSGPIPAGEELDHLCHTSDKSCRGGKGCPHRHCVNPEHLEAVPGDVNILRGNGPSAINARKTHCPQEHPLSGINLYLRSDGSRECRQCMRDRKRRYYQARKQMELAA